ncbi:hypothetical protein [Corynebacterium comes]|uniref:ABC-2 family transporter protein n=1 Tax=Corynebacterium comes TaxID=2675218 RepID=A0A6B8W330_9CORY|nr:hypothetical protein [Corynebacterium comes]QGU05855.1 ABC-2 family transporter protein [Corynebacterium comes]
MIRLNLRLRATFLIIWMLALWTFLAVFPPAYESYYPTPRDRASFLAGMQQNSGMTAMWGPLESPASLGQIVMWEAGSMMIILGSVMAVLLMVGLHRKEESHGQMELRLSTGIGRTTPAAAALLTTSLASFVVGMGSTFVLLLSGLYVDELPAEGAVTSGAVIALTMIGSALFAQLCLLCVRNPSSITRVGLLTVAVSFITRAVADSQNAGWLNWLSPLGWKTVVRPYVSDDWGALSVLVGISIAGAAAVLMAERYREYGQPLVRVPELGRAGGRHIRGPLHLYVVLNRGTVITWILVITGLAAFFIALTGSLSAWMEAEANVGQVFKEMFGTGNMKTEFIAYTAKICGILVATMGIQTIVTYRSGELDRTVDLQRSTGIRRWVPLGMAGLVASVATLSGTGAILVGGWIGLWSQESTTATDHETLIFAAGSQLAPTLMLTAMALALVGCLPHATHFAWAPVVAAAMLTLFGPVLDAPRWLIDISPFEYVVTAEDGSWGVHVWMSLAAFTLMGLGLWGARQREIQ